MRRLAAALPARCLASTWSPSRAASTTSDAALVRALMRRLHPDRVHGDAAVEAANTAAFAALSSWADDPHDGNHSHGHSVRVTAYFREGDGLRRVDAALPPRGAAPPRVALAPLLAAAGLVDQGGPASPPHTTESAAELAAALATRDAASFLSRAHALAAARRQRAAAPPPPTAEAAAIRAVHGVRLGFGPGLTAPGARADAAARAVVALAGVPPGTLRGARLTLTDAAGVASRMDEHGIWLAVHEGDAVWARVIQSSASPTDEQGTPAWRAIQAAAAAALRSREDAAATALGVGAVAAARGVRGGGRYGELLTALAETPPPAAATPRVAVRFVASTACTSPPPAGVIEVAIDATPSEVTATVAARAPAAAAAAADADRAATAAEALLTELKSRLGAEADVVAAPGACPAAVARAAADLLRSAPAVRRHLGGAWGLAAIRVGGAAHAISEDGREVVVGV